MRRRQRGRSSESVVGSVVLAGGASWLESAAARTSIMPALRSVSGSVNCAWIAFRAAQMGNVPSQAQRVTR